MGRVTLILNFGAGLGWGGGVRGGRGLEGEMVIGFEEGNKDMGENVGSKKRERK